MHATHARKCCAYPICGQISIIRQMPNLEVLSLSVNKISTLADFAHCPKLRELYLRKVGSS